MTILLLLFLAASIAVPALTRRLRRRVFPLAALVPFAAFVHTAAQGPVALGGGVAERLPWIPQLGIELGFRLDALSWVMALVVTGVGVLVIAYCARYFGADEPRLGSFAGTLLAFAGAMYGLVVADDVYVLFVFWEATTVFSYLLIGHHIRKRESRGAALQALLVTTLGGLVMLVGLVLLAVEAGTARLSAILADPPGGAVAVVAVYLVLVGALSKSALVPLHFWLPSAMAAPTPVSAYLHAAAMVKAGIYLIARLAPAFAITPGWRETLVILGVVTMLLGAVRALRQYDLKLLLAWGTVSQLGFLAVICGFGTRNAAVAGLALLVAHALFKAALFLVVGIVDHNTGTRDLRKLSGLGRAAPGFAVTALLAGASMAGLPPLAGFVAKEAAFAVLIDEALRGAAMAWPALIGTALGSVLTVAYTARLLWGAFATKPGVSATEPAPVRPGFLFLLPPLILAAAGLALGPLAAVADPVAARYADRFPAAEEPYHLALWHGPEPALAVGAAVLLFGLGVFRWLGDRAAAGRTLLPTALRASELYWVTVRGVESLAARTTGLTQRGSLPFYLGLILTVLIGSTGAALLATAGWPAQARPWDYPAQLGLAVVGAVAALAASVAQKRFQAVVLVGVTGYVMAALFALQGAPDLALTQVLVETVTLIAFVLVLRRLPARLGHRHASVRKGLRAVLGVAVGVVMAAVAVLASGARTAAPISLEMPRLAYDGGHGRNVVNVMLVDLRGWDTMGELSVLIAAATGVASLVFLSTRTDDLPRVTRRVAQETIRRRRRQLEESDTANGRSSWLLAGRTLAPHNRSILLEVVVRLLFHALIMVSLYLLLVGHNEVGGGFAGGLVAGLALAARYLAGGRFELGAAAPFDAGKVLGAGLAFAAGAALVPLFFGVDALTSTWFTIDLGWIGQVDFVTSTLFDVGVYLVVVGLLLDVLRSLGAEVDRHQQEEQEQVKEASA